MGKSRGLDASASCPSSRVSHQRQLSPGAVAGRGPPCRAGSPSRAQVNLRSPPKPRAVFSFSRPKLNSFASAEIARRCVLAARRRLLGYAVLLGRGFTQRAPISRKAQFVVLTAMDSSRLGGLAIRTKLGVHIELLRPADKMNGEGRDRHLDHLVVAFPVQTYSLQYPYYPPRFHKAHNHEQLV